MTGFASLLDELRRERGLRKSDLASRAGLSNAYVSYLTRGQKEAPSETTVAALCEALELDEEASQRLFVAAGLEPASGPTRNAALDHVDWGDAPAVEEFFGRSEESNRLERWIVGEGSRLVAVVGLGGIGKTALCVTLVRRLAHRFEHVVWRSMINAPPFESTAVELLRSLSHADSTAPAGDVDRQLAAVIECMRERPCLVVLDNLETLLDATERAGHFQPTHRAYARFIRQVAEVRHRSCVLLTAREKPQQVGLVEATPQAARTLTLGGLKDRDASELLRGRGLVAQRDEWSRLAASYSGNPLALKLAGESIRLLFAGEVERFFEAGPVIFGDIRDLLDQQFDRLGSLGRALLYWLAVEREAVSLERLQEYVVGTATTRDVLEALLELRRRCWLEGEGGGFVLQNVVMEYLTDRLIAQARDEIAAGAPELLDSHALVRAQAKHYLRETQKRVILQPIVDDLLRRLGEPGLRERVQRVVDRARSAESGAMGYAAGNAANLLARLDHGLNGCDFSRVVVREAYLAGAEAQGCDFSGAQFHDAVFTGALTHVPCV